MTRTRSARTPLGICLGTVLRCGTCATELLNLLVTKGVIPSITGWSISYFTDLSGQNVGAYIVKTGATPISVDAYLSIGKTTGALQGTATATATTGTTTTVICPTNCQTNPLPRGALYANASQYHTNNNDIRHAGWLTPVGDAPGVRSHA